MNNFYSNYTPNAITITIYSSINTLKSILKAGLSLVFEIISLDSFYMVYLHSKEKHY